MASILLSYPFSPISPLYWAHTQVPALILDINAANDKIDIKYNHDNYNNHNPMHQMTVKAIYIFIIP